jgi:hypothetical protein
MACFFFFLILQKFIISDLHFYHRAVILLSNYVLLRYLSLSFIILMLDCMVF